MLGDTVVLVTQTRLNYCTQTIACLLLLKAGEVWIPAGSLVHCFGIADPIIRLSFSSDSHPIVGATWPSQLLTRGLRMSTCCCHRPTKSHPTHIALLKSVPLHAMKAVTNFSLFSRSFVTSKNIKEGWTVQLTPEFQSDGHVEQSQLYRVLYNDIIASLNVLKLCLKQLQAIGLM